MPVIETFEVQLAVNQKVLAEQMMQMMKDSLATQNTQLSPRAELKYEAQLKRDSVIAFTSPKLEKINEENLTKRKEEERISTAGKSKLEVAHEVVSKADNEKRNSLFAAKAKKLEDEVKLEELEKLQGVRGIPFEI